MEDHKNEPLFQESNPTTSTGFLQATPASTTPDDSSVHSASADATEQKSNGHSPFFSNLQASHDHELTAGYKGRKLGIWWKDLTVKVKDSQMSINENVLSQFDPRNHSHRFRSEPPLRTILDRSFGCVQPGEMLLVLGRPGSGCTTLLKILSNRRKGYHTVDGDILFGSMTPEDAAKYSGQIVMNTEEEIFFPTLSVGRTMDFAARLKQPRVLPEGTGNYQQYQDNMKHFLLESLGISHTHDTKVGNEFVRGVSGGERKRVSIAECLATRGSIFCWDNSTRGLDASSALDFVRLIRDATNVYGLTSIVTLYQAGNGIYDLFDKILVLDEGKQIFYGRKSEAKPYMESLGFLCADGANYGDFLTGVVVPTERRVREDFQQCFPRSNDEIRDCYENSDIYKRLSTERLSEQATSKNQQDFEDSVSLEKSSHWRSDERLTVSLMRQISTAIIRQYQMIWGDKSTFLVKQVLTVIQALVAGSLFYNAPSNSSGLFIKSGALFFSLLYNSLLSMSEVTDSFIGRPVLIKHKYFAFLNPAAFCIAQVAADIPIMLVQITVFSIIMYFMVGFTSTAGAFFTYWILLIATTMCMTALFRAVGAAFRSFDGASKISGFLMTALVIYTGYMIKRPAMHPWFGWIFWLDPLSYAFEALLSNEWHDKTIECVGSSLIPNGDNYTDSAYQSCSGIGAVAQGRTALTGDEYLSTLDYSHANLWRDFGIVWGWWAFFVGVCIVATMHWRDAAESQSALRIPRERLERVSLGRDEERGSSSGASARNSEKEDNIEKHLVRNTSVFTWKDLCYSVPVEDGERLLLDHVQGWVRPGMLGALMGSSGAGKTTLLDVLAQRKTEGTIRGSILVDGRPLSVAFQRSTGYCEQLDVHEPYATVREALEFSALLRQPKETPRHEKLQYVDIIIDLLEMRDLENTLIGRVGSGLSVEQRKRVTIGVELVAKPSVLLFLDEPTSGLDGQSAYTTVRFLRKLANVGQAILVTIHQPSAQLFTQFDTLLLLSKGGKTVYFGDIGENACTLNAYFARNGAPCPLEANPAEHMINVVSGSISGGKDWNQVWLSSPEYEYTVKELDRILHTEAKQPSQDHDSSEYATSLWEQTRVVTTRMSVALWRNTDYVNNKLLLHIITALFNGFTFWMINDSLNGLEERLFTIYNFIFVAPGVINQLQPLFIERREIYDAREKKARIYSWKAFVTALIVSEFPYLCVCAVLYFLCWYYTVGFGDDPHTAGATFFVVLAYEFVYTSLGQAIAAYSPNATVAALANPVILGTLIIFCGVLVPYAEIQAFWRYWIYYINPFNYLVGSLLVFNLWDVDVNCAKSEFALFDPPNGTTCSEYLADYLQGEGSGARLLNGEATSGCQVCQYKTGSDYLKTLNLNAYYYGWRDAALTVLFAMAGYVLVFLMMKLRTKVSKKAE